MDPNTPQTSSPRKRAPRGTGKAGRPRKIGEAERKQIIAVVKVGGSMSDAAGIVGVSLKTIQNAYRHNPDFYAGVMKAKRDGKLQLIKKVKSAKPWQAAAWMLERKYGQEFGRKDRHEHTGANGGPIKSETKVGPLDLSKLSDEELETLRGLRAKAEPSVN
jgi:transposase